MQDTNLKQNAINSFVELNKIDVSNKIEKKNGLSYLSWAWAWGEAKKLYPEMQRVVYEASEGRPYFTDGKTGWVKVGITIDGIEHVDYLPIMDNRNKSIPVEMITSFDVNKSIQRSTVKAIALHGLGLYIYAGEDIPEATKIENEHKAIKLDEETRKNKLIENIQSKDYSVMTPEQKEEALKKLRAYRPIYQNDSNVLNIIDTAITDIVERLEFESNNAGSAGTAVREAMQEFFLTSGKGVEGIGGSDYFKELLQKKLIEIPGFNGETRKNKLIENIQSKDYSVMTPEQKEEALKKLRAYRPIYQNDSNVLNIIDTAITKLQS